MNIQNLKTYGIEEDALSRKDVKELINTSVTLVALLTTYKNIPFLQELLVDFYLSLYKYNPELVNEKEVAPEFLLNYLFLDAFIQTHTYSDLRSYTKSESLVTTASLESLLGILIVELSELHKDKQKEIAEYLDIQDSLDNQGFTPSGQFLEEAKEVVYQHYLNFRNYTQERVSCTEAEATYGLVQRTNILVDTIHEWGLGSSTSFKKLDYRTKLEILKKLRTSKKIKEISELGGKLKDLYRQAKKYSDKHTDKVEGTTLGNDISKVSPQETSLLTISPEGLSYFYAKYSEKKLQQRKYSGYYQKGKGPIIAIIDSSGSMEGYKEIWAKATAMALLEISRDQKRDFYAIHFAGNKENLHTNEFKREDSDNIQEMIDMAEFFYNGGTNFMPPLDTARLKIDNSTRYKEADIVMITDGQAAVDNVWLNSFLNWKKQKDVNIQSVLITEGITATPKSLEEFSDTIHIIDDIKSKNADYTTHMIFKSLS